MKKEKVKKKAQKTTKREKQELFLLLLLFYLFHNFGLKTGRVPSGSMEPTILNGDFVFRSVFSYGGTTPQTFPSIPFAPPKIFGIRTYLPWIQLPVFSVKPLMPVKVGDVCTFRAVMGKTQEYKEGGEAPPLDCREEWVKRVGGIAKMTIKLKDSVLYLLDSNGKWQEDPWHKYRQYKFDAWLDGPLSDTFLKDCTTGVDGASTFQGKQDGMYHYIFIIQYHNIEAYFAELDKLGLNQYQKVKEKKKSGASKETFKPIANNRHPIDVREGENTESYTDFKEVVVPFKGLKIKLDKHTHPLYIKTLKSTLKGFKVITKKGVKSFILNGTYIDEYTFGEDYLYVQGDNFSNSDDSRFFGFLPKKNLTARVECVFFNWKLILQPRKFFSRCFKFVM